MEWTTIIHTCSRCGASWVAPRDEPHDCVVERYRAGLVALYRDHPAAVAKVCDETIDRSGALLGEIREAAREAARRDGSAGPDRG